MRILKDQNIKIIVACLLLLFSLQAILSMRKKSVTADEIMYIASGYYQFKTGDFNNILHPPLIKTISALPLLLFDLELPQVESFPNQDRLEQWKYARSFLYNNRIDADRILFLTRLPIVLLAIILGLYVYRWSKDLYGTAGGILSLFLYSLSPNILANARLVTLDLGLTAFSLISTYYFWRYMNDARLRTLLVCGFFWGLAILTKAVALCLPAIWFIYSIFCVSRQPDLKQYNKPSILHTLINHKAISYRIVFLCVSFLIIYISALSVLNIGYKFEGSFRPLGKKYSTVVSKQFPPLTLLPDKIFEFFLEVPIPIPSPYIKMCLIEYRDKGSTNIFFAGNLYDKALWYFMPVAFIVKTPIPILLLLITSFYYLIPYRLHWDAEWLIIFFISIYLFIFTFLIPIPLLRYILPIYPFIHILIGRLTIVKFSNRKIAPIIASVLLIWYFISSLSIYPNYLAYFNETIGGPKNGYKYFVDSNLDWGQDLKSLKNYMKQNKIPKIKLAYFGSADPTYYGIDYDFLPSVGVEPKGPDQQWWYDLDNNYKSQLGPQKGTIAASATILASPSWMTKLFRDSYGWLRNHEPVDNVGYSILIYKIE